MPGSNLKSWCLTAGYEAFNPGSSLNQMARRLNSPILLDGLYILLAVGLFLAAVS